MNYNLFNLFFKSFFMKKRHVSQTDATRFKRFSRKSYGIFNSLNRVVNTGVVAVSILAWASIGNSHASTTTLESQSQEYLEEQEKELDEVVVTASRISLPINLSSRLVTVISHEEISRAPIQNLQDLLNYIAGVDITQRGAHGVQADISIRGGSFDQVAILLNGVNISNPQTGHLSLNLPINISDIDRIEIIHGASAITYGASAFSGGINIITKKNPQHKAKTSVQGGMFGLFNAELGGALRTTNGVHQLSAGYRRADGDQPNSDYQISNIFWQSRWHSQQSTVDIQAGFLGKDFGANTFYSARYPNQYEKTKNYYASIKAQTGDKLKISPVVYWNRTNDEFQLIKGSSSPIPYNYHQSDVYGANINLDYISAYGITSFGAELRSEAVKSSVLGTLMREPRGKYRYSASRTNVSYALEHNILLKEWTITAGLLANYNTFVEGRYKFYPALNVAYRPNHLWRIFASWNESTRMPSFTELYYRTRTHQSGANLKPETMKSAELGAHFNSRTVKGHFTSYINKGKDIIDWTKTSSTDSIWQSVNHAKITTLGFDSGVKVSLNDVFAFMPTGSLLQIDYTKQHQRKAASSLISSYSFNFLRDKFVTKLDLPFTEKWGSSLSWRWQKRNGFFAYYATPTAQAVTRPYPSFSTMDMQVYFKPKEHMKLFANINNLYNTSYYDLGNVPQPGFWATAGISYAW